MKKLLTYALAVLLAVLMAKAQAASIITTVAGNGGYGFAGDGGLATAASLYYPTEIAVDSGATCSSPTASTSASVASMPPPRSSLR